jgi:hypothetical protein
VPFERGHRHAEGAGDLLVRRSRGHQPQHLQLTSRQAIDGGWQPSWPRPTRARPATVERRNPLMR